ncbi:MAG: OmpA family protein, partial [Granulosicoccaceae bacterium]
ATDNNADGVTDSLAPEDTDGDSKANYLDTDSDNDGIPDSVEANLNPADDADGDQINDLFDIDLTGGVDTDADGVDDSVLATNTDADAVPDYKDLDSDNDLILDVVEASGTDANNDGIIDDLINAEASLISPTDSDTDGTGDWREIDSDNDGVNDNVGSEFEALDANGDGVVDNLVDSDGDGIADGRDLADGHGSANVGDTDGDGLTDIEEGSGDTDGDGVPDYLDPDSDNDGIPDLLEGNADANGNGVLDRLEDEGELETAVDGVGSGSFGLLGLLALSAAVVLSRGVGLAKTAVITTVALFSLTFSFINTVQAQSTCWHDEEELKSSSSTAQNEAEDSENFSCWYGTFGFGYSYLAPEKQANNFRHNTDEDHDSGWHVVVGKELSPHWFAEFKYADLGEAGITNTNPAIAAAYPNAAIDYRVPSMMVGYQWRPGHKVRPYVKAGVSAISNKAKGGPIPFKEQTTAQLAFGAGFKAALDNMPWFLRGNFDWYDKDAWYASLAMGLHMGHQKKQDNQVQQAAPVLAERVITADDLDGDGVPNAIDRCEATFAGARVDETGCIILEVIDLPGVLFASASSQLLPSSVATLVEAAALLKTLPQLKIEVAGYTDSIGNSAYNRALSANRAAVVRDYLISQGVRANRMLYYGYGSAFPATSNATAEGRAANRRVVLRILAR